MHASLLDGPRGDEGRPCGRQAGISTPALEGLRKTIQVSVITTVVRMDPLKRGAATALRWVNPLFRVFEPQDSLAGATRPRSGRLSLPWVEHSTHKQDAAVLGVADER